MRIAIISDTHLTLKAPAFLGNARAARRWIEGLAPDEAIHLGDITADGAFEPEQFALATEMFGSISPRMRFLPGNHDIGDNAAVPQAAIEPRLAPDRLAAYRRAFGPDRWSFDLPGWRIIGLNAQLIGAADQEERTQLAWLEAELRGSEAKLGVMLHKPFFRDGPSDTQIHQRYLLPDARRGLLALLRDRDLRFVVAGHTHQLRRTRIDGVEHVWVPSASYQIPDHLQETIGRKIVGAMVLDLMEEGHSFAFVEPPGFAQNNLADHNNVYPALSSNAG